MKSIVCAVLLTLCGSTLVGSLAHAGDLTVTISHIRSDKGQILVAVYDSADGWNKHATPVAAQKVAAVKKGLELHFQLPPGSYALEVMHDENENGKLDSNSFGVPTEGYGYSNNPNPMRRANFEEARFVITDAAATLAVTMR